MPWASRSSCSVSRRTASSARSGRPRCSRSICRSRWRSASRRSGRARSTTSIASRPSGTVAPGTTRSRRTCSSPTCPACPSARALPCPPPRAAVRAARASVAAPAVAASAAVVAAVSSIKDRIRVTTRVLPIAVLAACSAPVGEPGQPLARALARARLDVYEPARELGPLFHQVQLARLFDDSKTFVDAVPLADPDSILAAYQAMRTRPDFRLDAFVQRWFMPPVDTQTLMLADSAWSMEQQIRALWPMLTRAADTTTAGTLIPLPHGYVVPGGRFREIYYWDSYFTMLGLLTDGRSDLVRSMLDNFAYLVRTVGHIPNGNRTYYLSRSQPPFFAAMVGRYAEATDTAEALRWLDALIAEHAFWMDGSERLPRGTAYRRVVRLPNGGLLNRYWDDDPTPRPESYREDWTLGETLPEEQRERFYRNVRASAESGWDFSSRWMRDPRDLRTLETVEIAPIDLNSLLY